MPNNENALRKFKLTVQRDDSEQKQHIYVDARDFSEAVDVYRQNYPHMQNYFVTDHEILSEEKNNVQ